MCRLASEAMSACRAALMCLGCCCVARAVPSRRRLDLSQLQVDLMHVAVQGGWTGPVSGSDSDGSPPPLTDGSSSNQTAADTGSSTDADGSSSQSETHAFRSEAVGGPRFFVGDIADASYW